MPYIPERSDSNSDLIYGIQYTAICPLGILLYRMVKLKRNGVLNHLELMRALDNHKCIYLRVEYVGFNPG